MDLLDELQTRVVCGDGAMGTMLLAQGVPLARCLEEMCVSDPDRISDIHRQYAEAGAHVIKTNTFGGNAVRLARFGFEERAAEINRVAVELARKATQGREVALAGSVGPLGLTAHEAKARGIDRGECFREQIEALLEGGVDLIFFETFTTWEEMALALGAKREIADVLTICSFTCAMSGRLQCGTTLREAVQSSRFLGAEIVGVNCVNGPEEAVQLLEGLSENYSLAAYPNAGRPMPLNGAWSYPISPDSFAAGTEESVAAGARLVGGCCGTTPAHVKALARAVSDLQESRDRKGKLSGVLVH